MAVEDTTWKKPRSIAITIAWGVMNASIVLQAFLNGRQILDWYDLLLLFSIGIFAGALLAEMRAIVLGIFESIFFSVILTFFLMVLPAILGNVAGFYLANIIYTMALTWVFWAFFPSAVFACFLGGMLGGFIEDLVF